MTDQYTKLADALENIAHMEYPSGHHDGNNLREAAALLRAAAGVDVAGLMDVADRYALAQADPAHWRSALESDLRLALAAREGWQPIETAPKDGTMVILGASDGVYMGKHLPIYQSRHRPCNPWSSMLINHDHMAGRFTHPTHWMTLPTNPTEAEK